MKLWAGTRPVIGAKIEAVVQRLGFNNSRTPFIPYIFRLYDNGNGDPDITRGDGIYSRYFPSMGDFSAKYSIKIIVSDDNNRASISSPVMHDSFQWSNQNGQASYSYNNNTLSQSHTTH